MYLFYINNFWLYLSRAPEILFKPELIGRDHYGIHESIFKSILGSDIDLRRSFLGNIVLSGNRGSVHYTVGFNARIDLVTCSSLNTVTDSQTCFIDNRNGFKHLITGELIGGLNSDFLVVKAYW